MSVIIKDFLKVDICWQELALMIQGLVAKHFLI
jgi:hypothetical protein